MKKALIFGTGRNYHYLRDYLFLNYDIVGIIDNAKEQQGTVERGLIISGFEEINEKSFDLILVTPTRSEDMIRQLKEAGVERSVIVDYNDIINEAFVKRPLRIKIIFHGGIGDYLIGKNWLYHLTEKFNLTNERIDVCFDGSAGSIIRKEFEDAKTNVRVCGLWDASDEQYDVVLLFCIVPYLKRIDSERMKRCSRSFFEYLMHLQDFGYQNYCEGFYLNTEFYHTIHHIFQMFPCKSYHNFCDVFGDLGMGEEYRYELSVMENTTNYLALHGLEPKKYITIDTGQNRDYIGNSNTRAWSHEKWNRFAVLLKKKYSEYKVVQIGERVSQQDDIEVDLNLNGKTSFDEVKVLLKYGLLHVDYEGGLVHVRHILKGGPTVVLFGSTAPKHHSYSENIAIRTDVCPEPCEWKTANWLMECPEGYRELRCMESILPEQVLAEAERALENGKV